MFTTERVVYGTGEDGVDLATLGLKERQAWERQETFLAAYADADSIRKVAPAAQISREAVRIWQPDGVLGFRQGLELAQHNFREMLQDKALEPVKETKPGNNPLLLIALLNAHWPEKYRPNATPTDDTAKKVLERLRTGARKDQ